VRESRRPTALTAASLVAAIVLAGVRGTEAGLGESLACSSPGTFLVQSGPPSLFPDPGFFMPGPVPAGPIARSQRVESPRGDRRTPPSFRSELVTPDVERAVTRGLRYLANAQDADTGAFGEISKSTTEPRIAVTALAALAFLANGDTPGRGPFGRNAEMALTYLVNMNRANPRSLAKRPIGNYFVVVNDTISRMHGHGYATLAAAEALGMYGVSRQTGTAGTERLREAVEGAVALVENTQSREGGWYYEPEPGSGHEGSITITILQALRSARTAGIEVNRQAIDRALDYVIKSQNPDGSFSYALRDRRTSAALTAAAVATLHAFGLYDNHKVEQAIKNGMDYLERHQFEVDEQWFFYNAFYTAQALWFDPTTQRFDDWYREMRADLLASQDSVSGAWADVRPTANFPDYGRAYATAFACLILQMPYGYLPILQR